MPQGNKSHRGGHPKHRKVKKNIYTFSKNQILTFNKSQCQLVKKAKHVYKRKMARLFSILVIKNLISQISLTFFHVMLARQ